MAFDRLVGYCRCKQVPLAEVAAQALQLRQLLVCLDALSHDRHAESFPKRDDSLEQPASEVVPSGGAGKRPVDFDDAGAQHCEVRERGVPRAEVVERNSHVEAGELAYDLGSRRWVNERGALGGLEHEALWCK